MNCKFGKIFAGCRDSWLLGLAASGASVLAPAAQALCSDQDIARIVSQTQAANEAIAAGNLQRYVQANQAMKAQAPANCRQYLDRLQPMATRCTAQEKHLAVEAIKTMMRAVSAVDVQGFFGTYTNLERAVTPRCFVGINMHSKPDVVSNCTAVELESLAALAGPIMRATQRALETGDNSGLFQVLGAMPALSSECAGAIQRNTPRPPPQRQARPRPSAPGGVIDHGNGTYSVPGVAACSPSECMVF